MSIDAFRHVIEDACDPSPVGAFPLANDEGGHDSEFRCAAAQNWLANQDFTSQEIGAFLEDFCKADVKSRRIQLVAHNLAASHAFAAGDYTKALRHAETAFSSWQHDVYNHRLIIACKRALGQSNAASDLAGYLDRSYCPRPFEHFETTWDRRVYLCSPDYLTAPVADLKSVLGNDGKAKIAADKLDRVAWNTPSARYVRRSIIAGEYRSCSMLTCPMIQGRLLPERQLDQLPKHLNDALPHLVQSSYYDHAIYYHRSRVYAVPLGEKLILGAISDRVLVSYTVADLSEQIAEKISERISPLEPVDPAWFHENGLSESAVLTLDPKSEQGRVRERMAFSPRELMMTHDNSCNVSCPSCRTHTIIADKKQTEEYDRLVPVFLALLKDAQRLILSGSGDPFASRHFRRLMRAMANKETETYGEIELPSDFQINLMTNGLLLTPSSYEEFGLRGMIGIVALSMDSCEPETFERVRRGSKWSDLLAALEFIRTIRAENPRLVLITYFTVQTSNFAELPKFITFCREWGFQHVQLNMVRNFGAWDTNEFEAENIGSPHHPQFDAFMDVMASLDVNDGLLMLGNAGDYYKLAVQRRAGKERQNSVAHRGATLSRLWSRLIRKSHPQAVS